MLQLAGEAPRGVLADELWCGSASAAAHWQRQRRFGLSLAAASVAGYLLGIGDRHMDNMLLDLVRVDLDLARSMDLFNLMRVDLVGERVLSRYNHNVFVPTTLLSPAVFSQDSAELVHIDYNVCFEKGAKLRVPEIVPFR